MISPVAAPGTLDKDTLHGSLTDRVLLSMNFLNEIVSHFPDAISFAPGRPFEGFFDTSQITRYLRTYTEYLERECGYTEERVRRTLFQYGRTNGEIHELVARTLLNDEGIRVDPASIVVTVGCQEATLIVLRALCATPKDVILATSPCYVGLTGAARLLDIEVLPVPEPPGGLDPEEVRRVALAARARGLRPRAFYVVPDFSNPSGQTLDMATRRHLLDVADGEDLLILEDNPYGLFAGEGARMPTLKALDRVRRVVHLGSFAKSCFPGARAGYVVADQVVDDGTRQTLLADELSMIKSMVTVNTPALSQAVIGGMLVDSGCRLTAANGEKVEFYARNLQVLLGGLDHHFPESKRRAYGVDWQAPKGGFFVVLRLPFETGEKLLSVSAREYGVIWTPMSYFYIEGGDAENGARPRQGAREIRLSCSYLEPRDIEEGLRRLARFVEDHLP